MLFQEYDRIMILLYETHEKKILPKIVIVERNNSSIYFCS